MRSYGFAAAGAALLMSTVTAAADGGPAPSAHEPGYERYDWSGIYGGIQGGWLWGEDTAFEIGPLEGPVDDDGPLVYDTDGYVIGGVLGVNLQSGNWVYGGEFDVEYADFSGQWSWGNGNGLNKDINIMGSLRARVGFALDRILVYGTGGLAVGKVEMEAFDGPPPLDIISGDETPFGYTFGGGVEIALWGNWSAGAEYRFTDLGKTSHSGDIFNGDAEFDFTYTHTNEFHAVRARLVYRMGI